MRLFLLTALTMVAFAANSVLNRAALAGGGIEATTFGTVRLWAGALMLLIIAAWMRRPLARRGHLRRRFSGVLGLLLYIYGFSLAYRGLDAGLGALILFGTVQVTMFGGALLAGERPAAHVWAGAALAFGGLVWLLWPSGSGAVDFQSGLLMACAGVGWGIYSLAGRGASDPLAATAANFVLAAPLGLLLGLLLAPGGSGAPVSGVGLALAAVSGAVTSGLGYALWYAVLPRLMGAVAAVAQLTVPVIAMAGGMVFLSETLTWAFVIAAAAVLGGVSLSVLGGRLRSGSSTAQR